jgi:hypothetical protein
MSSPSGTTDRTHESISRSRAKAAARKGVPFKGVTFRADDCSHSAPHRQPARNDWHHSARLPASSSRGHHAAGVTFRTPFVHSLRLCRVDHKQQTSRCPVLTPPEAFPACLKTGIQGTQTRQSWLSSECVFPLGLVLLIQLRSSAEGHHTQPRAPTKAKPARLAGCTGL